MSDYFSDIQAHLDQLGVDSGMHLIMHSSLRQLGGKQARPHDLIQSILDRLGSEGCLLMPTFQNDRAVEDYVKLDPLFDPRNTPSQTGALTNLLWQEFGARRSFHTWLSVAAVGQNAHDYIKDHHLDILPFGTKSPYYKLMQNPKGHILLLGMTYSQNSAFHVVESLRYPHYPVPTFQKKLATMRYLDYEGMEHRMQTLVPLRPFMGRWREFGDDLEAQYPEIGKTLHSPLGYRLTLLHAPTFLAVMGKALDRGMYPWNKHYMPRPSILGKSIIGVKRALGIKRKFLAGDRYI